MPADNADRTAFSDLEAAALVDLRDRNLIGRLWQRDAGIFGLSADATRTASANLSWLFRTSPSHSAIDELVTVAKVAERHNLKKILFVGDAAACAWIDVVGRHLRQRRGAALSTLASDHPGAVASACDLLRANDAMLVVLAASDLAPDDVVAATWPALRAALADDSRVGLLSLGRHDDTDGDHAERIAASLGLRPADLRICRALPAGVGPHFLTGTIAGLLAAALAGVNVRASVERIEDLAAELRDLDVAGHPAAPLAAWLAAVIGSGHRHLHIAVGRDIRAFGVWIAALLQAAGCVSADGSPLRVVAAPLPARGPAAALSCSAVVAVSTFAAPDDAAVDAAEDAGVPTWRIVLPETMDLWAEALRWQTAIALLGALRGVDTLSSAASAGPDSAANDGLTASGALTASDALAAADVNVARLVELDAWLRPRVANLGPEHTVSIRCALAPTEAQRYRGLALQTHLQEHTAAAVCVGFGPGPDSDDAPGTTRVWVADREGESACARWASTRVAPTIRVTLDPTLPSETAVATRT